MSPPTLPNCSLWVRKPTNSLSGLEFHFGEINPQKRGPQLLFSSVKPALTNSLTLEPFPLSSTPDIQLFNHLSTQCILNASYLPCALLGAGIRKAKTDPAPPPREFRAWWAEPWWALLTYPFLLAPLPAPTSSQDQLPRTAPCLMHICFSTHSTCLLSSRPSIYYRLHMSGQKRKLVYGWGWF